MKSFTTADRGRGIVTLIFFVLLTVVLVKIFTMAVPYSVFFERLGVELLYSSLTDMLGMSVIVTLILLFYLSALVSICFFSQVIALRITDWLCSPKRTSMNEKTQA